MVNLSYQQTSNQQQENHLLVVKKFRIELRLLITPLCPSRHHHKSRYRLCAVFRLIATGKSWATIRQPEALVAALVGKALCSLLDKLGLGSDRADVVHGQPYFSSQVI